ncbi:hypothetical protein NDU88_006730 [Pleurodeles waltl]|uniref:Nuclear apoptosis-inducing factor 1 n=1 Tax=Pleurodeles waltl TaxID=8319 RepID=A0AAV7SQI4_PLEWA|nr:hypothetical protein NDU88_006730 [Pleurodeles waltl]
MDSRCLYRDQEDDRPGTSQEEPHKNQDREKKKRKCCFSAEEQEILVKEVREHQHQLFVTSKLPISRREAIWQQIVDKINSVAEVRRTVVKCKKRWHDCKRRTKEKMARNRKAALQTGGWSTAQQEPLDHMEEMVAAVIPEEIVTGIQGQDSADYQETTYMQENRRTPIQKDAARRDAYGATGTSTHGLTWTTLPDFLRGNRRDGCREKENSTHSLPERRAAG